jgi:hypothetical protein
MRAKRASMRNQVMMLQAEECETPITALIAKARRLDEPLERPSKPLPRERGFPDWPQRCERLMPRISQGVMSLHHLPLQNWTRLGLDHRPPDPTELLSTVANRCPYAKMLIPPL